MGRESKEMRIKAALPLLEARKIWLVEDAKNPKLPTLTGANKMLVDQALRFPLVKNDDMLDNQGYMVKEAVATKRNKQVKQTSEAFIHDDDLDDDDEFFDSNRNKKRPKFWPK